MKACVYFVIKIFTIHEATCKILAHNHKLSFGNLSQWKFHMPKILTLNKTFEDSFCKSMASVLNWLNKLILFFPCSPVVGLDSIPMGSVVFSIPVRHAAVGVPSGLCVLCKDLDIERSTFELSSKWENKQTLDTQPLHTWISIMSTCYSTEL